jgi:hypothetical protein
VPHHAKRVPSPSTPLRGHPALRRWRIGRSSGSAERKTRPNSALEVASYSFSTSPFLTWVGPRRGSNSEQKDTRAANRPDCPYLESADRTAIVLRFVAPQASRPRVVPATWCGWSTRGQRPAAPRRRSRARVLRRRPRSWRCPSAATCARDLRVPTHSSRASRCTHQSRNPPWLLVTSSSTAINELERY